MGMSSKMILQRLVTLLASGIAVMALLAGCTEDKDAASNAPHHHEGQASGHHAQPYAGLQNREIRSLPPERMQDILEGKGAGFALAAELNHYPGPKHVLELSDNLQLTAEQKASIEALIPPMKEEAVRLGARLIELERSLDEAFRQQKIDEEKLSRLTDQIAETEGRLRFTHLKYHLTVKELLSQEQVQIYDRHRGYTTD